MIYLIVVTFIAELIIAVAIISKVIAIDTKVRLLSDEIELSQNELQEILTITRQATVDILDFINLVKLRIIKYRNKFVLSQLKAILQSILIICFKPKYKKLFLGIKFGSKFVKRLAKKYGCYDK